MDYSTTEVFVHTFALFDWQLPSKPGETAVGFRVYVPIEEGFEFSGTEIFHPNLSHEPPEEYFTVTIPHDSYFGHPYTRLEILMILAAMKVSGNNLRMIVEGHLNWVTHIGQFRVRSQHDIQLMVHIIYTLFYGENYAMCIGALHW